MSRHSQNQRRGSCLQPTDHRLLAKPLRFIQEDHLREREICAALDRLAGPTAPDAAEAEHALAFLSKELPLHLEDEEEDLFPLLQRRCKTEDDIARAIKRLSEDHEHAGRDTPKVIAILRHILRDKQPPCVQDRQALERFTYHARRHLTLENAIILPFARLRLTEDDHETLRLRMMQRRGYDPSKETEDAQ